MKKPLISFLVGVFALLLSVGAVSADPVTFASTNEANKTKGWAHVNVIDEGIENGIGWVTLEFVSTRAFFSCFEYRTDGDTSQATGAPNFNPQVPDLYPYKCVKNSTAQVTLSASEFVEVRMVFGAESDERFDWTKFEVLPGPQTIKDCQTGGWESYGFSNQGQCIKFVNTGK